jgi:hypothetical protein
MVRCGTQCPLCAHKYRGDMWQLAYAGMAGERKGVPEQVAEHARVFASLTAPSFGAFTTVLMTADRAGDVRRLANPVLPDADRNESMSLLLTGVTCSQNLH